MILAKMYIAGRSLSIPVLNYSETCHVMYLVGLQSAIKKENLSKVKGIF